jgi:hypothetical protein
MLEIVLHLKQHFSGNKIKVLKRIFYLLVLLTSLFSFLLAQSAVIRGVILDEAAIPIRML